ncbi:MAG: hypothetical protein RMM31_11605 [Anaerolineae bacterium]|nr:hypothetical protein [Thermoflexales bacterium]MDW8396876.1 hypothetical protein [Anaerolineae bacterium]
MHPQRAKTHIAIVVDTSVARAAGESSAQSRACRDALLAVQDNQDCLLAISQALQQEWLARSDEPTRPHASRFAAQWLAKMESRGRVVGVTLPSETPLRRALEQVAHSGAPLAAHAQGLLKDLPVIETALYVE